MTERARTVRRRSKVIGLEEVTELLAPGDHLAVGGIWNENVPSALLRAVIRSGMQGLRVSSGPAAGYGLDLLLMSSVATEALVANVTFEHLGLAPGLLRRANDESVRLVEVDEAVLIGGYKAAAAGLPATIVSSVLGTEAGRRSELLRQVVLPGGERVGVVPPLRPDVALLHTAMCDPFGNAVSGGAVFVDRLLAKASKRVVVSTEQLVDNDVIREQPQRTTIPSYLVQAVVHAPQGAHPCGSHGIYSPDEDALLRYLRAARESMSAWDAYVASEIMLRHEQYVDIWVGSR